VVGNVVNDDDDGGDGRGSGFAPGIWHRTAQSIGAQLIKVMGIPRAHSTHSSARPESIDPWVVNHC
jgi:hypothetical protein